MIEKVKRQLLCMQRYSWEQGVAMQAFWENGEYDIVIGMAKEAVYRQTKDGRTATIGAGEAVTDPCSVGEALIKACELTKDQELEIGLNRLIQWAIEDAPKNEEGILYHLDKNRQFWADSLYMLPPFLVAAGYIKEALINFYGYWETLISAETGLLSHMWDEEKKCFIREAPWGGGNGWALAAGARMCRMLPEEYQEDKNRISKMTEELLKNVLQWMRPDGYFHDVIDDSTTFVETNLSQMSAYTIYSGIADGWLTKGYKETADKLRAAVMAKIDDFGQVQDVCGAPRFNKPGVSPEGQAFFILMESVKKYSDMK